MAAIALQLGNPEQHVLGGDVVVLEVRRLFEGVLQRLGRGVGKMRLRRAAAGNFRQLLDLAHRLSLHRGHVQSHALQKRRNDALAVLDQRRQNVDRLQLRITMLAGEIVRPLHRLLCLDS